MRKRSLMGGPQHHARRLAGLECLLPARCAQAPTITGPQALKAELGKRSREIIAAGFREGQKPRGHDRTYGVTADIFAACVAASVPEEPGHRLQGANIKPLAEHIAGIRPPAPASRVVSQHQVLAHGLFMVQQRAIAAANIRSTSDADRGQRLALPSGTIEPPSAWNRAAVSAYRLACAWTRETMAC